MVCWYFLTFHINYVSSWDSWMESYGSTHTLCKCYNIALRIFLNFINSYSHINYLEDKLLRELFYILNNFLTDQHWADQWVTSSLASAWEEYKKDIFGVSQFPGNCSEACATRVLIHKMIVVPLLSLQDTVWDISEFPNTMISVISNNFENKQYQIQNLFRF